MRNYGALFIFAALLLVASCNRRECLDITYFKQLQSMLDGTQAEDSMMINLGLIEYDSVRFSDGSYAVHRLQSSPQNSQTEFFDSEGRRIATVARASECYAQTLVYGYDAEGRLAHLLEYKDEIFEGLEDDSTSFGRSRDGYLGFREMIAGIDYEHPDTAKYEQRDIVYDKDGDAVKTYVVFGHDSVVAPSGYKLAVAVEPCPYFWESDIDGGTFVFRVSKKPKKK